MRWSRTDVEAESPGRGALAPGLLIAAAAVALVTIFLHTNYLARLAWQQVVLPHEFPVAVILGFVASGVLLGAAVLARPQLFWPVLVATALATGGVRLLRFPIYDEWLLACIASSGVVAVLRHRIPRRVEPRQTGWFLLFFALALHLLVVALAGAWAWSAWKALRFAGIACLLGVLAFLLWRYAFPTPPARKTTLLLAVSGLAYFALYLIHGFAYRGFIYEASMEGIGASGAAYAVFPVVVVAPAAFLLMGRGKRAVQALGWITFAVMLVVLALSDARGGQAVVLGMALLLPFALGWRPTVKVVAGLAVGVVLTGTFVLGDELWGPHTLESMVRGFRLEEGAQIGVYRGEEVAFARGDAERRLLVIAGIESMWNGDPVRAVFGAGQYGYFHVAGDELDALRESKGVPNILINSAASLGEEVVERPRPPAWGAFIVETGLLGLALLGANALLATGSPLVRAARNGLLTLSRGPGVLIASAVPFALFWGYFGEIQDFLLFYLLLMPMGVVHVWSQGDAV